MLNKYNNISYHISYELNNGCIIQQNRLLNFLLSNISYKKHFLNKLLLWVWGLNEGSSMANPMFQRPLQTLLLKYIPSQQTCREMKTGMQLCNWLSKLVILGPSIQLLTIGTDCGVAMRLSRLFLILAWLFDTLSASLPTCLFFYLHDLCWHILLHLGCV